MTYKKYTEIFNPPGTKGEVYGDTARAVRKMAYPSSKGCFRVYYIPVATPPAGTTKMDRNSYEQMQLTARE